MLWVTAGKVPPKQYQDCSQPLSPEWKCTKGLVSLRGGPCGALPDDSLSAGVLVSPIRMERGRVCGHLWPPCKAVWPPQDMLRSCEAVRSVQTWACHKFPSSSPCRPVSCTTRSQLHRSVNKSSRSTSHRQVGRLTAGSSPLVSVPGQATAQSNWLLNKLSRPCETRTKHVPSKAQVV